MQFDFDLSDRPEGYVFNIHPTKIIKECGGCRHHQRQMVKSGQHPIYKTDCIHPEAPKLLSFESGNLDAFPPSVPDWCPCGARKEEKVEFIQELHYNCDEKYKKEFVDEMLAITENEMFLDRVFSEAQPDDFDGDFSTEGKWKAKKAKEILKYKLKVVGWL